MSSQPEHQGDEGSGQRLREIADWLERVIPAEERESKEAVFLREVAREVEHLSAQPPAPALSDEDKLENAEIWREIHAKRVEALEALLEVCPVCENDFSGGGIDEPSTDCSNCNNLGFVVSRLALSDEELRKAFFDALDRAVRQRQTELEPHDPGPTIYRSDVHDALDAFLRNLASRERGGRIAELEALGPGWDSYGGKPPTEQALERLRGFDRALAYVPMGDGGVQVEFHALGLDFEAVIDPSGQVTEYDLAPPAGEVEGPEHLRVVDAPDGGLNVVPAAPASTQAEGELTGVYCDRCDKNQRAGEEGWLDRDGMDLCPKCAEQPEAGGDDDDWPVVVLNGFEAQEHRDDNGTMPAKLMVKARRYIPAPSQDSLRLEKIAEEAYSVTRLRQTEAERDAAQAANKRAEKALEEQRELRAKAVDDLRLIHESTNNPRVLKITRSYLAREKAAELRGGGS